uniref:Uncharacterized protein n=1 Tax=Medicago truncatula TaxID=3880 RepID=Q2HVN3_MEDTR|nr:hypothetical protein MtrDRAFT_AC148816g7v2 [Medicago truncatula]
MWNMCRWQSSRHLIYVTTDPARQYSQKKLRAPQNSRHKEKKPDEIELNCNDLREFKSF